MREFGSDFHLISAGFLTGHRLQDYFPSAQYYADGRQALINLYRQQGWKRIWVPEYFCYDVYRSMIMGGLNLSFYTDYPGADDDLSINRIQFEEGDALFRVNYFGIRGVRNKQTLNIPVVEDHTHDLIGDWALNSDADWCFASLRKSLPIAEGGILWSPQGHVMPPNPHHSDDNERVAKRRWLAMKMKSEYLAGESIEKSVFRNEMIETESFFDSAIVSSIDEKTRDYLGSFNIFDWYIIKQSNREELETINAAHFEPLLLENQNCNAFSFTVLCDSPVYRDILCKSLIKNYVYPAILWDIPESASHAVRDFSSRMLSIHCDGRYSKEDILQMKTIIESVL